MGLDGGVRHGGARVGARTVGLALALAIGLPACAGANGAAPVPASTCFSHAYSCTIDGYDARTMSDNWAAKYYGPEALRGLGEPPHNCTLFVAWMLARHGLADPGRSWGDAYQWGRALARFVSKTPTVGSIAWYALGRLGAGTGHVAWVARVNRGAREVFLVSDNYGGTENGSTSSGWTSFSAPSGYIHLPLIQRPRPVTAVTRAMVARVRGATPGS